MSLNEAPVVEAPAARSPLPALLAALAGSAAVIVADIFLGHSPSPDLSTAYGIGSLVGTCLGAVLFVGGIAYAILHFTALRGENRRHRLAYAAILLVWCGLVAAGAVMALPHAGGAAAPPPAADSQTDSKTPG